MSAILFAVQYMLLAYLAYFSKAFEQSLKIGQKQANGFDHGACDYSLWNLHVLMWCVGSHPQSKNVHVRHNGTLKLLVWVGMIVFLYDLVVYWQHVQGETHLVQIQLGSAFGVLLKLKSGLS